MKKILVAGIAAAALCGAPALAADMPVKAPVYKAAPAPMFSWTGCYVGGNIGGGWARNTWNLVSAGGLDDEAAPHSHGLLGGGQVGCDYQAGAWVFGVEGMFDWSDLRGSALDPLAAGVIENDKFKWLGTATGRVGYAFDRTLFYAKGGAAWVNGRHFFTGPAGTTGTLTQTTDGWVVGGGVEWSFAPQWSVKVEYDHIDLSRKNGLFSPNDSEIFGFRGQKIDAVTVGLNYRFGDPWGKGPVSAKY
jgi:outer membrane immunogenic protein